MGYWRYRHRRLSNRRSDRNETHTGDGRCSGAALLQGLPPLSQGLQPFVLAVQGGAAQECRMLWRDREAHVRAQLLRLDKCQRPLHEVGAEAAPLVALLAATVGVAGHRTGGQSQTGG